MPTFTPRGTLKSFGSSVFSWSTTAIVFAPGCLLTLRNTPRVSSIVRIDDTRGVFLSVNKQPGANTIAVVDQEKTLLPKLLSVPRGVKVGITFDQSTYLRQAIASLWHEALQGSALAFLVILIFLRSLTSTLIISIAIPLSILLSFIVMYFLGQTLNVFTLGGLALAVGRLVDD